MCTADWVFTDSDREAVKQGCYFDYEAADRVRRFFAEHIRHSIGATAGEPFILLQWQWERVIAPAFGWKMPDGTRRFTNVEVWIPKKNGKSTLAAAIALYLLTADGEYGSHVYGAASDKKQASIIFNEAVSMARKNPEMEACLKIRESLKIIRFPETDSKYEVLSSDGYRNEGLNIHGLLFDELHAQPNRALWAALKFGGASRKQPITFVMSTAGEHDEESLWWERFHYAKKIQESKIVDIRVLACVYAIEDNEDWQSEEVWKRVNPSWGETVYVDKFLMAYQSALISGTNESDFLRYRLNRATKFESAWIKVDYWNACKQTDAEITQKEGGRGYLAVDLSDHLDLTAIAGIREVTVGEEDKLQLSTMFFAPTEPQNQVNKERYKVWESAGLIRLIPGPICRQELIEDEVVEWLRLNNSQWNVRDIGVDRFNSTRFSYSMKAKLRDAGFYRAEVRQVSYNAPTLNDAMKELESMIFQGTLIHDDSPIMRFMFHNCMASMDSSGNRKLDKARSKGKIDGFAALLMAVYLAINQDATFKSKYSTQRLRVVST